MTIRSATVVGLGRLGMPIAASLAVKGVDVIGVDVDETKVRAIAEKRTILQEPRLGQMLEAGGERLSSTTDIRAAAGTTDATFVVVPTPSRADGGFSTRYVLDACADIGAALRDRDAFSVVILMSTVLPGVTGGEVRSTLELESGKRCGVDFGLCYSPEFVALGSVIDDFLNPDLVLIGESEAASGDALEELYGRVCENRPTVVRMSFASAEITKLSLNTFVTTKIAFANMIAEFCEAIPGGDVDHVASALGVDRRIGHAGLKGALGYGGPCFPRDNQALATFAREVGVRPLIPEATDEANHAHLDHVLGVVRACASEGLAIGVLGLAYKAGTDVVERSAGIDLAIGLASDGRRVFVFDPTALGSAAAVLRDSAVQIAESIEACVAACDVIVVATLSEEFATELPRLLELMPGRTLVDCWRMFEPETLKGVALHIRLGVGPDSDQPAKPSLSAGPG